MELLLPMAAKKLDLSFNITPDVPACIYVLAFFPSSSHLIAGVTADYARIRQGGVSVLSQLSLQTDKNILCSPYEFDRQRCEVHCQRLDSGHLLCG